MVRRHAAAAGLALLVLALTSAPVRTDDPVSSAVRFNKEIIRIFDRKCLACHAPGAIAMSLATYRDVRPWSRAIREEILEQRMPPWPAARGYATFKQDIGLTPRELTTILTWLDGGLPRGDESDLPAATRATAGRHYHVPDHEVEIGPQHVPGEGQDVIRRVAVDLDLPHDRWVREVQVRPGDRRLLRAAFVSAVSNGRSPVWAGAWTPWQTEAAPPAPGAFLLRAGSRLEIELHYRGQEAPSTDRSSIALFFAPEGAWREMTSVVIETAPAHQEAARRRGEATLAHDAIVWGVRPAAENDGHSLEVTARKPDGSVEVLLWIPKVMPEWPGAFIFTEPVRLPAGTRISAIDTGPAGPLRTRAILTLHEAG